MAVKRECRLCAGEIGGRSVKSVGLRRAVASGEIKIELSAGQRVDLQILELESG